MPSETNSLPAEAVLTLCIIFLRVYHWLDTSAGRLLVPEGIIRPVVSVSVLTLCIIYLRVYHWVDTSAGKLLVSEGIIRPVVSVSVLTLCIRYLRVYHWVDTSDPVINTQIYNTQCQYRNTDYWADDALGE
jgi:hypothetical protein